MWMVIDIISIYIIIGLIYGIQHMSDIYSAITRVGEREKFLREMVILYDVTPKGADYYTQLQELYIGQGDHLAEYKSMTEHKMLYQFQTFLLGSTLWPFYMISIFKIKQTTNKCDLNYEEKE